MLNAFKILQKGQKLGPPYPYVYMVMVMKVMEVYKDHLEKNEGVFFGSERYWRGRNGWGLGAWVWA